MKKQVIRSLFFLSAVVAISSCAAIIHGSTQSVEFASRPTGAKLFLDGKEVGSTPQTINLRRKGRNKGEESEKTSYAVKVEMEGFQPYEIKLERKLDGWIFGNILFGGLIGIVIDAATGSMYKLSPKRVDAEFAKTTTLTKSEGSNIYVAVTLQPDPTWEKIGEMTKATK